MIEMKKSMILSCLMAAVLLTTTLSASMAYAYPDTIREKTFITYYGTPLGEGGTDTYNVYAYSGIHWAAGTVNIAYSINTSGAPSEAYQAIQASFETWDTVIGDKLFNDNPVTVTRIAGNKFDGKNVISWGRLGKNIIAQTTVWYNTRTQEIVEFGMVFSTAYKWGIDPDGEGGTSLSGKFDVQDIATHEAGHTLMLDDLYDTAASQLTMYGYGSYGQTYARSLGTGDITGIKTIYP